MQISKLRCQEGTARNARHDEKYLTVLGTYEMSAIKQLERQGAPLCVFENKQGSKSLRKVADLRGRAGNIQDELAVPYYHRKVRCSQKIHNKKQSTVIVKYQRNTRVNESTQWPKLKQFEPSQKPVLN